MKRQTRFLIIGIGMASILAGIYSAVHKGELMSSLSAVFIGVTLIGTVIMERYKKDKTD